MISPARDWLMKLCIELSPSLRHQETFQSVLEDLPEFAKDLVNALMWKVSEAHDEAEAKEAEKITLFRRRYVL